MPHVFTYYTPLGGGDAIDFLRAGGMINEGKGKATKKSHGAEHVELFIMVGDNRIELVPQRTHFEGAKRGTKCSESRMQEVK